MWTVFFKLQNAKVSRNVISKNKIKIRIYLPDELISMPRGHPTTPVSQRLRTMFWADSVMACAKVSTAVEFESLIARDRGLNVRLSSGLWSRYLRGEAAPAGARLDSSGTLVEKLGRLWPETRRLFEHPVWDLLEWTPGVDLKRLYGHYLALGDDVCLNFCRKSGPAHDRIHSEKSVFWHLQKSPDQLRIALKALGDDPWAVLAVALLEARMGYAGQRIERFVAAQTIASDVAIAVARHPRFERQRMQMALLVMEGLCLVPLRSNAYDPPVSDEQSDKLKWDASKRISDWRSRLEDASDDWSSVQRLWMRRMLREAGADRLL